MENIDNSQSSRIDTLYSNQGDLADLQTTDKSSLVAAINEVAGSGSSEKVEVNYTTSQTWSDILTALGSAADASKVTTKSTIRLGSGMSTSEIGNGVLHVTRYKDVGDRVMFVGLSAESTELRVGSLRIFSDIFIYCAHASGTYTRTDLGSTNPTADGTITLYY